jgi:serine/threonine protein kinase
VLAEVESTGTRVAIKLLNRITEDARNRFRREVRLLHEQINNRFVVDVLAHDLTTATPYIVMEYCEGGSLRQYVGKQCDWKTAAQILSCAVQGLAGIHRAGGYHRDIKPDNLLLRGDGQGGWIIKVSDFGLGRTPNSQSSIMTHSPAGTQGYMAPEIVSGSPYHPAADIYSLGVTIIELLTGQRSNRAQQSAQVPLEFIQLLNAMTNAIPHQRPSIQKISAALYSILERRQPLRRPEAMRDAQPQPQPVSPRFNLSTGLFIAGGLALLALLAGGDDTQWDARVGRYRGSDGQFRHGKK